MSYDYTASLDSISRSRLLAFTSAAPAVSSDHLGVAVEELTALSSFCPLPPELFSQYAHDASLLVRLLIEESEGKEAAESPESNRQVHETYLGILEQGILEFPGSLILRVRFLEGSVRAFEDEALSREALVEVLHEGYRQVRYGCYFSSRWDESLSCLFDSCGKYLEGGRDWIVRRAHCPCETLNDSLMQDASEAFPEDSELRSKVEAGRKLASGWNLILAPLENSVSEAMNAESILSEAEGSDSEGTTCFVPRGEDDDNPRRLMGLGGQTSASAFVAFAKAVAQQKDRPPVLVVQILERGVSECPTVEFLWKNYYYLLPLKDTAAKLEMLRRATRNCPYSVSLHVLLLNECDSPDDLVDVVTRAKESGFIPREGLLELYLETGRVMRRLFMSLTVSSPTMDGLTEFIEEMRQVGDAMLDLVDPQRKEGSARLHRERAVLEGSVLSLFDPDYDEDQAKKSFEAAVKLCPWDVRAWREYLDYEMARDGDEDRSISKQFRLRVENVRQLYHRAMSRIMTTRFKAPTIPSQDPLTFFCEEYLQFEERSGTLQTLQRGRQMVNKHRRKMSRDDNNDDDNDDDDDLLAKRKAEHDNSASSKRMKTCDETDTKTSKPSNLKQTKAPPLHTIQIGVLKYPAHPYTIKISSLPPQTKDMDLVRAFKPLGGIVHARLLKQTKHNRTNKTRDGVVQFEERDSVEKALAGEEDVQVHGEVVTVMRSHLPAVAITPVGGGGRGGEKPRHDRKEGEQKIKESAGKEEGSGAVGGRKLRLDTTGTAEKVAEHHPPVGKSGKDDVVTIDPPLEKSGKDDVVTIDPPLEKSGKDDVVTIDPPLEKSGKDDVVTIDPPLEKSGKDDVVTIDPPLEKSGKDDVVMTEPASEEHPVRVDEGDAGAKKTRNEGGRNVSALAFLPRGVRAKNRKS